MVHSRRCRAQARSRLPLTISWQTLAAAAVLRPQNTFRPDAHTEHGRKSIRQFMRNFRSEKMMRGDALIENETCEARQIIGIQEM